MDWVQFICLYLVTLRIAVAELSYLMNYVTPQYNSEILAQRITEKPHLIMYHAPWCGHCQRAKVTVELLAQKYNVEQGIVTIAGVDCTQTPDLCLQHNITSYPTIILYWNDVKLKRRYKGRRDVNSLNQFIQTMLDEGPSLEPVLPVLRLKPLQPFNLTEENFTLQVSRGQHFINFHAPWCGHCKQVAPVWEQLRKEFHEDLLVSIAQVDCTISTAVCSDQEIKGFPSLMYYNYGEKVEEYTGEREFKRLVEFVLDMKVKQDDKPATTTTTTGDSGSESEFKSGTQSSLVSELNPGVFSLSMEGEGLKFVSFYAPWCPHCQSLSPTFLKLAEQFTPDPSLSFYQIDCSKYASLCSEQNVRAFPTIALYSLGKQIDTYGGLRTTGAMEVYINEKKNTHNVENLRQQLQQQQQTIEQQQHQQQQQQQQVPQQQNDITENHLVMKLTEASFNLKIHSSCTFINFYQPWCTHCISLEPVWNELAHVYSQHQLVVMASVNCGEQTNTCDDNKIDRYPTLAMFCDGERLSDFSGSRDVKSLSSYIEESLVNAQKTSQHTKDEL